MQTILEPETPNAYDSAPKAKVSLFPQIISDFLSRRWRFEQQCRTVFSINAE